MKAYYITALFMFMFFAGNAQKNLKILDGNNQVLVYPSNQTEIQVCNLQIGSTYFYNITFDRGLETFEVKLKDKGIVDRENSFLAKSECKTFSFQLDDELGDQAYFYFNVQEKDEIDKKQMTFDVTPSNDPTTIIKDIFQNNKCFEIIESSIRYTGDIGTYENGEIIGSPEGIIMSTGNVQYAEGGNFRSGNRTTNGGQVNDDDLAALSGGYDTYDVSTIEFDFIPTGGYIFFQYIFASEEYCDFVDTEFNDAFGFFLSGPGINGNFTNNAENLAVVGDGAPVSINTINWETNFDQYISNVPMGQNQDWFGCTNHEIQAAPAAADQFEFDGFTKSLTAFAQVEPCEVYHLKMAVADISDNGWDSAVFLKAKSFFAGGDALLGAVANGSADELVVYENCGRQELIVEIDRGPESLLEESMFFGLEIGGTADVFDDYSYFVPFHEIPAFQETYEIPITIYSDDIPEGTETIEIQLATACTCELPVIEIEIREIEPFEIELQASPACEGTEVRIEAIVTGGAPDYEYRWNNGFTGTFIEVDPEDREFFSVRVEDQCGTKLRDTIYLDILSSPFASLSGDEILCNENDSGALEIEIQGEGPFQIVVQNPLGMMDTIFTEDQFVSIPYSEPGEYQLVSLEGACPGSVDGLATIEINDLEIDLLGDNPLCREEESGLMSINIEGGEAPYTIEWEDGSSGVTLENIPSGNYQVTVTDDLGCSQISNLEIFDPSELEAQILPQGISTCVNPFAGTIDVVSSGGTPPYTYAWNNNETAENLINLEAGVYVVTVTDQNGCSVISQAEIPGDNSLPDALAEPLDVLNCNNSTIIISTDGSSQGTEFSYSWMDENGSSISNSNPTALEVNAAGFYTLTVTNLTNGCDAEFIVEVEENIAEPAADPNMPDILNCTIQEVELNLENLSDNTQVIWSSSSGESIVNISTSNAQVSSPGEYSATMINSENGCQNIINFTIEQDLTEPEINLTVPPLLTCEETSFLFDGTLDDLSTEYLYSWYFNGALLSDNSNVEVAQTGTYTIEVTNSVTGCASSQDLEIFADIQEPNFNLTAPDDFGCTDISLDISSNIISGGTAGFAYNWDTQNGNILSDNNQSDISIGSEGIYLLTLTDLSNGCTSSEEVVVAANTDKPIIDILPFDILDCNNQMLVLDASNSSQGAEFQFVWQTNTGNTLDNTSLIQNIEEPGEYTLLITNTANGCSSEQVITVEQDLAEPQVFLLPPDVLGCINTQVSLSPETINEDYTFTWNSSTGASIISNSNAPSIDVNQAGIYEVIVTNNLTGCTALFETEVTANDDPPIIDAGNAFTLDCNQDEYFLAGTMDIEESIALVSWTSSDGNIVGEDNILNPQISSGGTYLLTITNTINGCETAEDIRIEDNRLLPEFDFPIPNILTCEIQEVELFVENFNSSLDLSFSWSQDGLILNNEIEESINTSSSGQYTVIVTNNLTGCSDTKTIQVDQDIEIPMADAGFDQELDCNSDVLTLDAAASQGAQYEYEWQTNNGVIDAGGSTLSPTISASGEYTLIVTNTNNGCTNESSLLVNPNDEAPIIQTNDPAILTCDVEQIIITGVVENVGNEFTYIWEGPNNFVNTSDLSVNVALPGTYILSVINGENGCESSFSVQVEQDLTAPELEIFSPEEITCAETSVQISSNQIDPNDNYEFSWSTSSGEILSNSNTQDIEVGAPGIYVLDLINLNTGCTNTQEIVVSENIEPPIFSLNPDNIIDCNNPLAFISIDVMNNAQLASEWQVPLSGSVELIEVSENQVTVNQAGTYTLLFTNIENGCTASQDVLVEENLLSPIFSVTTPGFLNCNNSAVNIIVENSNGMNYSYQWFDLNQNLIPQTGNVITVSEPGSYTVSVTNLDNGCITTEQALVSEDQTQPIANIFGDNQLNCEIASVNLQASDVDPNNIYVWLDDSGDVISNTSEVEINLGGEYTLLVTNPISECVEQDNFIVMQTDDVPVFNFTDPQILDCRNTESNILVSTSDSDLVFDFTTNNGNINSFDANNFDVTEPGIYTITAINPLTGCEKSLEVEVIQDIEAPEVDAGPGFELDCTETSYQLQGSTNLIDNYSLNWATDSLGFLSGVNTLSPIVNAPGFYELTIVNERNGCSTKDIVEVRRNENVPSGIYAEVIDPLCAGDLGAVDIYQIDGGEGPFIYSIDDGESYFDEGLFSALPPGSYDLRVQDQNGCEIEVQVEIPEVPEVFASLPPELELEFGDNSQLLTTTNIDLQDIETITWSPSTNLSCDDCLNPQVIGIANESYTITIVNENGCVAQATIQLRVDRDISVYIPNGFSPLNLDGINDVFMIFAKEGVVSNINTFQVYDRWGTEVFIDENFMPNDPAHGWDGRFRDESMNPGVFVYWAEIEFIDGTTEIFKGDVSLLQ